jgi:hypothetical protein
LRQGVLAGAAGAGKNDGVREPVVRKHLAEAKNDVVVAVEIGKGQENLGRKSIDEWAGGTPAVTADEAPAL